MNFLTTSITVVPLPAVPPASPNAAQASPWFANPPSVGACALTNANPDNPPNTQSPKKSNVFATNFFIFLYE
jgi:hypothetical protein